MLNEIIQTIWRLINPLAIRRSPRRVPRAASFRWGIGVTRLEDRLYLSGSPLLGPIALDNSTTPASSGNVTSLTWSHTVGSGSDGILIVDVSIHQDHHTETVASVTYGGQALTRIAGVANGSDDAEMWYLLAPSAGTANVVVTVNGNTEVTANATDYFGVDQTTPLGTPVSATATSAAPSVTVASAAGELVLDSISVLQQMAPLSPGAGQTQLWNTHTGGGGGGDAFGAGGYQDGAASVVMSWNVPHSSAWAMVAVALKPAQGDTPVVSVPASESLNEDATLTFSSVGANAISITDPDAGSNPVQLTLSASHGVLTLGGLTGLTLISGANGTSTMTVQGTLADINAALDGLTYAPATGFSGTDSLAVGYNDLNANGGGIETANGSVALSVISATPLNTVPGPQTTTVNTPLVFSSANGNQVSVADGATGLLQETLTATNGTLTLAGTTGLAFTSGTGTGDVTMSFTGTIADINSALDGLVFQPANNLYGAATFQITSVDNTTGGGPYSAANSVGITIAAGVQPEVFLPGAQSTNENGSLVFSSIQGNAISVDDDNPSMPSVTLTVTNGTLTLSQTTNLTFTAGTGSGDTTMTFSGALSDLNAALDGLTFTPSANYFGAASLQATIDDPAALPSSASGGVGITVNHVNAAPVNTVPGPQTANAGGAVVFSSGGGNAISVSDPAAGSNPLQVTLTAANGTLTLNGTTNLTFSSGTGSGDAAMTFTGTIADINNALNGLRYQPANNFFGADTLQIVSTDYLGVGGLQSASMQVGVSVNPASQPPASTSPGGQSVNENAALVLSAGRMSNTSGAPPAVMPFFFGPVQTPIATPDPGTAEGAPTSGSPSTHVTRGASSGAEPTPFPAPLQVAAARPTPPSRQVDDATSRPSPPVEIVSTVLEKIMSPDPSPQIALGAGLLEQVELKGLDELWTQLDAVAEQFFSDVAPESLTVDVMTGVSAALSTGYVVWLLRAGSLVASVLSSLPAWRTFDPLPVLDFWEKEQREKQARLAKNRGGVPSVLEDDALENALENMLG